jgi:O-antigen/teichoic acid export membrane protein
MTTGNWSADTRTGIVWSGTAFLAGKSLTFLATLVLARLLVPAEFGVVAAIMVYLTLIELVSDLGMQATVVYEQEEGVSERVQTAFTINLALVLLLTGVAVALAPAAADFFDVEGKTHLFRLGALNLILVGLGNIPDALLLRGMQFRRRAGPLLVRAAISGTVSITLALAGLGPEALVFGLLAGSAGWTGVLWLMTPFRPRLSFDAGIARSMAGYGFAATLLDGLSVVATRLDQAVIGPVLGAGALGLYTIGFRVPEVLIQNVTAIVSHVAFPALARQRMLDARGLADATLALVRYQALYALPVAVGVAVLASPLIVVLFSSAWREAGGVTAAIAVRAAIGATGFPLGDTLKAVGQQRLLVALNIVELPLMVALIVAAAPEGIVLVAWTRAVVQLLHVTLLTALASRVVDVRLGGLMRAIAPALVASAGVGGGAGVVRLAWSDPTVFPLLAGLAAGLLGGLFALRAFAPEQVRSLLRHLREITSSRRARAGAQAPQG